MAIFDNLTPIDRWRVAGRDIAIVKAVLDDWGYPPDGDVYHLLAAFMTERIGRQSHDDADRDIVHHPV